MLCGQFLNFVLKAKLNTCKNTVSFIKLVEGEVNGRYSLHTSLWKRMGTVLFFSISSNFMGL